MFYRCIECSLYSKCEWVGYLVKEETRRYIYAYTIVNSHRCYFHMYILLVFRAGRFFWSVVFVIAVTGSWGHIQLGLVLNRQTRGEC